MFPNILEIAKVIPIYTSGDKHIVNNYCPISLLSPCSKIFEKLIFNRFFKFLDLNPNPIQVWSLSFNTTCNFIHYNNCLYRDIDKTNFTGLVTLDLTKVFDTVCHERLLSFITKQCVRISDFNHSIQHKYRARSAAGVYIRATSFF